LFSKSAEFNQLAILLEVENNARGLR
jgi:hypothetical protein